MRWQDILKTVAPTIGTALGGPMAAVATKFIAEKFLGDPNASIDEIAKSVLSMTAEQKIKLKELDQQFELEIYRTDAQDRASARDREVKISQTPIENRDNTPRNLAYMFVAGYFTCIIIMFFKPDPSQIQELIMSRLQDVILLIVGFFFGSSQGSRVKDMYNNVKDYFTNLRK